MTLRRKTLLAIGGTLLCLIAALYAISAHVLLDNSIVHDRREAVREMELIRNAFSTTLDSLDSSARDYVSGDKVRAILLDGNQRRTSSMFSNQTFLNRNIDYAVVFDRSGRVVYSKGYDAATQKETVVPPVLNRMLGRKIIGLIHRPHDRVSSVVDTPTLPLLITARPIRRKTGGHILGILLLARWLDSSTLEKVSRLSKWQVGIHRSRSEEAASGDSLGVDMYANNTDNKYMDVSVFVRDIYQKPSFAFTVGMPRTAYNEAVKSMLYLLVSTLVTALIFARLIMLLLQKLVLGRLSRLSSALKGVASEDDSSVSLALPGDDELSHLSLVIGRTLDELARSQRELEKSNAELDLRVQERTAEVMATTGALESAQQVLNALMKYVPDGIAIVDASDLHVLALSDYGRELLGISNEDWCYPNNDQPDHWHLLCKDGLLPISTDERPLSRALKFGEVVIGEEWIIDRPGRDNVHVLCDAGPIRDENGTITAGVVVFRNFEKLFADWERLKDAYSRERHIAEVLQDALMPHDLLSPPGYGIAGKYHAALKEAEIGGDFYDVFRAQDGRIALVIGDVSGKGLNAAVHTAMAKYLIRAFAHLDPSPQLLMERLNEALCDYTSHDDELFVTIFYGILDSKDHTFVYANAGHNEPLFYGKTTRIPMQLEVTGRVTGIAKSAKYEERSIKFDSGDCLVLYTDGVTDAGREGSCLGVEGLCEVLMSCEDDTPSQIAQRVLRAAKQATADNLRDDAAVLVVMAEESLRDCYVDLVLDPYVTQ